jgi:hypothetical protein
MIEIKNHHLLVVSMIVFIVLNLIENYFHYAIGYNVREEKFRLPIPSPDDWSKIIFLMILFGYLQGWFTEYFSQYY